MEQELSVPLRLAAAVLLVFAVAMLSAAPDAAGAGLPYAGGVAAVVLALVLMPAWRRWRCVSCGARYLRRGPPRGAHEALGTQGQSSLRSDTGPDDAAR